MIFGICSCCSILAKPLPETTVKSIIIDKHGQGATSHWTAWKLIIAPSAMFWKNRARTPMGLSASEWHVCRYGRVEKIHFDGVQICRGIAAKAVS